MTLAPGTHLGQYEILSPLAAGGMGEVYRARDSHLGREVAIKVLPADMTGDPAARRRFEQEAKAVALLSHSNILSIHHFDTHDGISFAVTELLEGETLRDRIARSKIPARKACEIAAAISDGLAAAQEKGIVHRDLKPSNIFLTSGGQVKILDFGLARVTDDRAEPSETTDVMTSPGKVVGTLGYMSPEQLRGETVDGTTDIFALGCILYEMLGGKSPFARSTATETMAAALRDEPPDLSPNEAPPALMRLIRRSLEKDRSARYHSARDLAIDLRSLLVPNTPPSKTGLLWAAAGLIVAVVVVLLAYKKPAAPPHPIRSIVVLPFENESHDPGAEYLSDGIAEGLISALAELPDVRVVARTTAFHFKGKPVDLPQIRKQLDVDAVLAGRLLSRSNDITVQADLIDAVAGTELWGNRFHEQSTDLEKIEQEIVNRISEALRVRLTTAQQSRVARSSTRNPEAYKLYLQGRFYWNKRNPEAITKARELLDQAIRLDPQFALAYSGLADAYNMLGGTYHVLPVEEGQIRSREAAQTALRLDPNLAEAHASVGLIEMNQFRWARAEKEFQRAIDINPNYTNALLWDSLVLLAQGHVDESLAIVRKAEQIDPLSSIMVTNVAMRLEVLGRYDAALIEAEKGMELDPGYHSAYWRLGGAFEGLGLPEKAAAIYERGTNVAGPPGNREALLARARAVRQNLAEAKKLAHELEQRAMRGEVQSTIVGWAYSAARDPDKALQWLNRALDAHEPLLRDSIRTTQVKELRGDPHYTELLRRLERGFEE